MEILLCPNSFCMNLVSVPLSSKWVAKLWRRVWGVAFLLMLHNFLCFLINAWIEEGEYLPPFCPSKSWKVFFRSLHPDYSRRNLFMNKAKLRIMRKSYVYTMRKWFLVLTPCMDKFRSTFSALKFELCYNNYQVMY